MLRLALVVAAAALFVAGGAAAFLFLRGGAGHAPEADAAEERVLVEVGEILTNLADADRPRYVQLTIQLEVSGEEAAERLKERMPWVRDAVIALLRATRYEELRGEEGMRALGQRIAARLNAELEGQGQVRRVLFTAFLVQ